METMSRTRSLCVLLLLTAVFSEQVDQFSRWRRPPCPETCQCDTTLPFRIDKPRLIVTKCSSDPKNELLDIFHSNDRLTFVVISEAHLSALPCTVSRLVRLKTLYLRHNALSNVPCNMSALVKLRRLDLSYNKLVSVPCLDLSKLTRLEYVILSHNDIASFTCELSGQLRHLDVSYNRLKVLSCQMSVLSGVKDLHLEHNQLEQIDCDPSTLVGVQLLNLSSNGLVAFPCELSNVASLEKLYLSNNTIKTVQCDFDGLVRLKHLDLSFNELKSVRLGGLSQLQSLDLSFNNLKVVQCDMARLPRLKSLLLGDNTIEAIDCDLSGLGSLDTVDLGNNNLKSVPCELSKLPSLTELNLARNNIDNINCSFPGLRVLHLGYNKFASFPCQVSNLSSLRGLHLDHNHMEDIHCNLSQATSLYTLDLGYNDFTSIPLELSTLPKLVMLYMSHNIIDTVQFAFYGMLYELDLSYNALKAMPCELLDLPKLKLLYLSHNVINAIPCNLSGIRPINELDLSYNCLRSVPSVWPVIVSLNLHSNIIEILPKLTGPLTINASNNVISSFTNDDRLLTCEQTTTFDLRNNNIAHIMDIFIGWNLPMKRSMLERCMDMVTKYIGGNPLMCDCVDYRLYEYLRGTRGSWGYLCSGPGQLVGADPLFVPRQQFVCNISVSCPAGCSCTSVPYVQELQVMCEGYNGDILPENMPELQTNTTYRLDFTNSSLRSITFRRYFKHTSVAIFSHSSIMEISIPALQALAKGLKVLHLDNNNLEHVPKDIQWINFQSLVDLRVEDNPWVCDCQAAGLRNFIMKYYKVIQNVDLVRCHSPSDVAKRSLTDMGRNSFCNGETRTNTAAITVSATVVGVLVVVGVVVGVARRGVKEGQVVYVRPQDRGLDEDQEDEGRRFDIFVSYATDDEEYAGEWLIPELERRGFKICFHRVHFLGGLPIHVNMFECINNSKRTLAFVSPNFVASPYCMWEFEMALELDIDSGTNRLVTIKDAQLHLNTLEPSLESYFRTHTYVTREDRNFWENLLFTMPSNKLGVEVDLEVEEHAV